MLLQGGDPDRCQPGAAGRQSEAAGGFGVSRTPSTSRGQESDPALSTVERLVRALEDAGVEIIDAGQVSQGRGVGVRLRRG
jgi:hypothetical protein